jgi:hypothetical protein
MIPRSKLLFKVIPMIKDSIHTSLLTMAIARFPFLPVFCGLEAVSIAEILTA